MLLAGISVHDFNNMTIGEVADILKEKLKKDARTQYDNAVILSSFVVKQFNGKAVPRMDELYPNLFPKPEEDYATNEMMFRQWAQNWNLSRKKKNDN